MLWIEVMPCLAHQSSPRCMMARSAARSAGVGSGSGSPPVDRPSRTRLLAGELQHRTEGLALAQLAFGQTVGAHDDLVAGAERRGRSACPPSPAPWCSPTSCGGRAPPWQKGRSGRIAVEMVAGDALAAENRVVRALAEQHRRVRVRCRIGADRRRASASKPCTPKSCRCAELGGAGEQMHMASMKPGTTDPPPASMTLVRVPSMRRFHRRCRPRR